MCSSVEKRIHEYYCCDCRMDDFMTFNANCFSSGNLKKIQQKKYNVIHFKYEILFFVRFFLKKIIIFSQKRCLVPMAAQMNSSM